MDSLLEKYGWNDLLSHSNFSFLIGASHPHELLTRACELGYSSLGLCDFNGVYGLARAYRCELKLKKEGCLNIPKLIYGAEVNLAHDHHLPIILQDNLCLFAKNARGYAQLCSMLSTMHEVKKHDVSLPLKELLKCDSRCFVAIQPMRGVVRQNDEAMFFRRCETLKEHFGDNFYLTVSRHLNPSEDKWIPRVLSAAQRYQVPLLLSQDSFFHKIQRKPISDAVQAMRLNKTLSESVSHMFVNRERCLHDLNVVRTRYGKLPCYKQALMNSYELTQSFQFSFSELRYQYPKEMIPEGYTAQSYLEQLSWKTAQKIYGELLPQKVEESIYSELELIHKLGFADYFLTVWDIVRWARSQDILCQGRGSAANSAVCYVLGITSVNPSNFDLLFERFMSAERGDPPDIDVDFEHERREEVIQYIYRRYGRNRAAMVANVITFRTRGAFRFTGKALGISEQVLSQATKIIESFYYRKVESQDQLGEIAKELETSFPKEKVEWKLWVHLANSIRGFPRHLGIHSGGFMISQTPITALCATEAATMEGRSVIQWCKDDVEALGFFKIDVLALGMLTAIRKTFELINKHYNKELTLANVPQEDAATYNMIQKADTVGVFQIESRAQMTMLPRLRPKTFYDLVVEVAIIRPGPIQGGLIHPYLKRRHGLEPVTFPNEKIKKILSRTLGIPIFQEQVMRIAMEVGGFTGGEADELRRHISAWQIKGALDPYMGKLATGMRRNGLSDEFIATIIGQMKAFADYGFPESHAASFAFLAYVSSYLKCHFPTAFFTALLNSQPMGFYSPHSLIQTAKHQGIAILPVCVQKSDWDTTMEALVDEAGNKTYGIRLGMRLVNSLAESVGERIIQSRASEKFADLEDFLVRTPLFRHELVTLAGAGAFESFGYGRRSALWISEAAPFCKILEDEEALPPFRPESESERIDADLKATGTTLARHPSAMIKSRYWSYSLSSSRVKLARELGGLIRNQIVAVFGMVIVKQAPPQAKGMVFFTMEDESGFLNLAFSPQVYRRYHEICDGQPFLCVEGRLQKEQEYQSIMVKKVFIPKEQKAPVVPIEARDFRHLSERVWRARAGVAGKRS